MNSKQVDYFSSQFAQQQIALNQQSYFHYASLGEQLTDLTSHGSHSRVGST